MAGDAKGGGMMGDGFIKLSRNGKAAWLIKKHPKVFALATVVAMRARRANAADGLEIGEARLGDHNEYGMSRQTYRTTIKVAIKLKILTTRVTSKGTIAKLVDKSLYDINEDVTQPSKQPPPPEKATTKVTTKVTTNEECTWKKGAEEKKALAFFRYWNSKPKLPGIKSFTEQRRRKLKTRLNERLFALNWQAVIDKVAASKFCTGGNDRGWKADVDWILKNDTNYTKVLEGKYDNHGEMGVKPIDPEAARQRDRLRRKAQ